MNNMHDKFNNFLLKAVMLYRNKRYFISNTSFQFEYSHFLIINSTITYKELLNVHTTSARSVLYPSTAVKPTLFVKVR